MMVAIKAVQSFCTYVGSNCVTAHEGGVVYVPKQKADELIAGGLAVLVEDAPPAPPETKVSAYTAPEFDPTQTHEDSDNEPDNDREPEPEPSPDPEAEADAEPESDPPHEPNAEPEPDTQPASAKAPTRRPRQRTRK